MGEVHNEVGEVGVSRGRGLMNKRLTVCFMIFFLSLFLSQEISYALR